ncbi:hypothetical protein HPB51_006481 [Rhipicephalus microplus]|uniref:Uncharacterized protein n=1 Tax=Rhipicephalus microplus TaxID=6941 RepID=A0A9J6E7E1_RHIMP|nr:hypothetical protein HPB51_006481 [Rhipicephalus microplus]
MEAMAYPRDQLAHRGVVPNDRCPNFDKRETGQHAMFQCWVAKGVWHMVQRLFDFRTVCMKTEEQNPGPMSVPEREQISKIEEMLKVLQSGQVTVLEKLSGIAKTQDELRKKLDDVITKTNVIEKRLTTLEETEKKFADKLDDLENRSRRTNLVFFGIPDSHPKETWEESENLVKSVCTDVLKLENIAIERAHRLGAYKTERIRPIIASFSGSKSRESVLRNAYRFKGTSYSVSEDFSKAVQEKRRQLWKYSKEKQLDKKNRVHLSYDKLVINGQAFAWDTDMHQPVPLRAHAQILGRK